MSPAAEFTSPFTAAESSIDLGRLQASTTARSPQASNSQLATDGIDHAESHGNLFPTPDHFPSDWQAAFGSRPAEKPATARGLGMTALDQQFLQAQAAEAQAAMTIDQHERRNASKKERNAPSRGAAAEHKTRVMISAAGGGAKA